MANGVNKAILIGHLGRDPELKYTSTNQAVCEFSIATTEKWKGKTGEPQERVEWHNIVVWGKIAEICGKNLAKGRLVCIEGRIQTRTWDDKEGRKHYKTEIIANEVHFLDRKDAGSGGGRPRADEAAPPAATDGGDFGGYGGGGGGGAAGNYGGGAPDDDIPF